MIFLLDQPLTDTSHSRYVIDIIKEHTNVEVKLIELITPITYNDIKNKIYNLLHQVTPNDIVLCTWMVDRNQELDDLFIELANCCYVIAAAGNYTKPIENFTPAGTPEVLTVGALNKKGMVAALSNYSKEKEIIWVPGTNYNVGWKNSSGTSISAALYAAFLAEAIKINDLSLLDMLIQKQKDRVFRELS